MAQQYFLKPNPQDKRNVSQADIKNNFTYLQTDIGTDHNFTTDPNADGDGYHTVIHYVNQSGALGGGTPAPIMGVGQLYTKTITNESGAAEQLFYQQGTDATNATECCLTVVPIRASVSVNPAGAIQGTAFNATVAHTGTGAYTVTFPNPLPSEFYQVSLSVSGGRGAFQVKLANSITIATTTTAGVAQDNGFDLIAIGG
jgi:hypothetical protein